MGKQRGLYRLESPVGGYSFYKSKDGIYSHRLILRKDNVWRLKRMPGEPYPGGSRRRLPSQKNKCFRVRALPVPQLFHCEGLKFNNLLTVWSPKPANNSLLLSPTNCIAFSGKDFPFSESMMHKRIPYSGFLRSIEANFSSGKPSNLKKTK